MSTCPKIEWYSALNICSYNAILNIILGGRNIGKTWAFKKRTYRRGVKQGKKVIWVRRTKAEATECSVTFYTSKDLQKFCGLSLYDKKTNPDGDIKQNGRTIYIKRNNRWEWLVKVVALSEYKNMRSVDDIECDTVIFDEFTVTPEKYVLYRGNEAQDLIDLCVSIMRQHEIKIFLSGNKESVNNPILTYFNIRPLALTYQGIRTYKKGTIAIQQVNDVAGNQESAFKKRFNAMLSGTAYSGYLTKGEYKNQPKITLLKPPKRANSWLQLYWKGQHIHLWHDPYADIDNPCMYVTGTNDLTCRVFSDQPNNKYKRIVQLQRKAHRNLFRLLEQAVSDNRVAYRAYSDYENIQAFYAWLGIRN